MNHNEMFPNAKWVMPGEDLTSAIFRSEFDAKKSDKTEITVCGLGYFILYINGKRVSTDELVPAYSDYIPRQRDKMELEYPLNDVMDNRIYCLKYDISDYVTDGKNVIGLMLGGGYFHQYDRTAEGKMDYGNIRLCYRIVSGESEFVSDENMLYKQGFIKKSSLFYGENHDYNGFDYNWNTDSADMSGWKRVEICKQPDVPLYIQECAKDKITRVLSVKKVASFDGYCVYDTGENITGYALVRCSKPGQTVTVKYAENLDEDKNLHFGSAGGKRQAGCDEYITDCVTTELHPYLLWHGFRYFSVTDNAEPVEVREIHADVSVASAFECSDITLNWLFNTYIHTQLCNTHSGIFSDCPHRERLGYTGDGQLCAPVGMLTLDSKSVYKKWIYDIVDSQDKTTGHVQHTAPFAGGGGGPAGWGGAIISVPYYYYRAYGETDLLKDVLPNMLKFVDYMESRCDNGIIVREEDKGWCLGDWCAPEPIQIPESYVNTCMYIMQLKMLAECQRALGESAEKVEKLVDYHIKSVLAAFPPDVDGSFLNGIQGADAFAVECGIGDGKTLLSLVKKYSSLGMFDTGIFGTYYLIKVLFENHHDELAFKLLSNKKEVSFEHMRLGSATTLWENWNGEASHNHPMFGAAVRFIPEYILGVRQTDDSNGYSNIIVAPAVIPELSFSKGYVTLPQGKISVNITRSGSSTDFEIELDPGVQAQFKYMSVTKELNTGLNKISVPSC